MPVYSSFSFATRHGSFAMARLAAAGATGAFLCVRPYRDTVSCNPHASSIPNQIGSKPRLGDHAHSNMPERFGHTHQGMDAHLLLAVPKKGRLFEAVNKMLIGAGVEYSRKERLDIAHCKNLPVSIVFLPAHDIPTYVGEGDVDLGITGEDMVAENEVQVDVLMKLGMGKCNLSVQAPANLNIDVKDLAGKRIVTSFPNITRSFFKQYEEPGKPTQIKVISGSVEAACGLGLADGIVDLVETGTTMRAAGLTEVSVVMKSQTVLIANPKTKFPELVEILRKRMQGYMTAQSWLMVTYNVKRKNLPVTSTITPGRRSPSVQPLEDSDWVAVAALVDKTRAASVMDELEAAGATDILLSPILSTRMGE